MYKWDLHFSYLCNGLVQAEGGIQLFSFCCMYRVKSFREKAGVLWERSKGLFRIPHWFLPSTGYWILLTDWKILQMFLKFWWWWNFFHWSHKLIPSPRKRQNPPKSNDFISGMAVVSVIMLPKAAKNFAYREKKKKIQTALFWAKQQSDILLTTLWFKSSEEM